MAQYADASILGMRLELKMTLPDGYFAGRLPAMRPPVALKPGTRLLREWQGTTHEVRVLDAGFDYAGQTYKSLSAVARAITGTPWSGPLFFGIKR